MEESWLSRPDNGSIVAVSRPDVINRLAASGRERKDIFLTGSPMFDQLADSSLHEEGLKWRADRNINIYEKVIFWAEQPEPLEPDLPRKVRSHLVNICRKNGWKLVVRLHPSSTDATKEQIPDDCIQSHAHESLAQLIHACDVAVTLTSTVGWEVLLSLKPLLVINVSPYSSMVSYGQDDGALTIEKLDDAEKGINLLFSNNSDCKRLSDLRKALPKPGFATKKICDLIESKVAI